MSKEGKREGEGRREREGERGKEREREGGGVREGGREGIQDMCVFTSNMKEVKDGLEKVLICRWTSSDN